MSGTPKLVGDGFFLTGAMVAEVLGFTPADAAALTTANAALTTANGLITALQLKSKYQAALINGVHMKADAGVLGLSALAGGAAQGLANTQANALQAAFAVHAASVGIATADGSHKAADTGNAATLAAVPVASDLATSITLVNALKAAAVAHGNQSGVHFHDDAAFHGVTITTDPPTTLAQVVTDLNDLLTAFATHFALASV